MTKKKKEAPARTEHAPAWVSQRYYTVHFVSFRTLFECGPSNPAIRRALQSIANDVARALNTMEDEQMDLSLVSLHRVSCALEECHTVEDTPMEQAKCMVNRRIDACFDADVLYVEYDH